MKRRGVVMKTRNGKAVVLLPDGEFIKIRDRGFAVGDMVSVGSNTTPLVRRMASVAAALLILMGPASFAVCKFVPWSYVSVAVGEYSLVYEVNELGEVLRAETLTEAGAEVVEATERYEPIAQALERFFNDHAPQDDAEEEVTVAVSHRFGNGEPMEKSIEEVAAGHMERPVQMERVEWKDAVQTHRDGVPMMKPKEKPDAAPNPEGQPDAADLQRERPDAAPIPGGQPNAGDLRMERPDTAPNPADVLTVEMIRGGENAD